MAAPRSGRHGVHLSYIALDTNIGEMLTGGELDAALVYIADRNLVDRSRAAAAALSAVRLLFADPVAEGVRYYRKTGLLPLNHAVVIRTELTERQPWLALNVYSAFLEAKRLAPEPLSQLLEPVGVLVALGWPARLTARRRSAAIWTSGPAAVVEELGQLPGRAGPRRRAGSDDQSSLPALPGPLHRPRQAGQGLPSACRGWEPLVSSFLEGGKAELGFWGDVDADGLDAVTPSTSDSSRRTVAVMVPGLSGQPAQAPRNRTSPCRRPTRSPARCCPGAS